MAVEIIGEAPEVLKEAKCRGCGALLRYGTKDVNTRIFRDYSGSSDAYDWIVCPRCQGDVKVYA